jgi:3-deoxy-manno-octulosonate cytidylyltransferase (CMP-KDO synthetase)
VVIATDDERIAQVAHTFSAEVLLTSPDHSSGTDRLQEVVSELSLPGAHIVVNVQGDEPLIPPAVIDQVAANLAATSHAGIATLCEPIESLDELLNPNVVKVVTDESALALYFSRAAIPWPREHFASGATGLPAQSAWFRHIGIYAYRVDFLHQYVRWEPSPLEVTEQLEQLRALHNGVRIHVAQASEIVPAGVDTQSDLDAVRAMITEGGAL